MPAPLIREVPTEHELHPHPWFWKVAAGAALASFFAVVLLAWHASRHPRVVVVEVPSMCGVAR
jgi:hypothetical protein